MWKLCGKDKEGQKRQVGNEWAGRVGWVRRRARSARRAQRIERAKKGMKNRIKDFAKKNVNVSLQTDNGSKVGYLYA